MIDALMSNEELDGLRSATKLVTNPRAQWREKPGRHRQRNFTAEAEGGAAYRIYLRENLDDDQDFSCGLSLVPAIPAGWRRVEESGGWEAEEKMFS